jgi:uracil-DNA glycosylase
MREECKLCRPKLIVTLGEEVAQVVSGEWNASADKLLHREIEGYPSLNDYPVLFLPHPDACRRSEKWRKIMEERVRTIRQLLSEP